MYAKIIVLALLMAFASGERSIDEPVVDGYDDLSADLKIGLRDLMQQLDNHHKKEF
jgi:hypothetical protein